MLMASDPYKYMLLNMAGISGGCPAAGLTSFVLARHRWQGRSEADLAGLEACAKRLIYEIDVESVATGLDVHVEVQLLLCHCSPLDLYCTSTSKRSGGLFAAMTCKLNRVSSGLRIYYTYIKHLQYH